MNLERHLADLIRHDGPLRVDRFMALANAHYYATRDPLGAAGDFTTAPEISQVFGELIGACLVDHWERSGSPSTIRLVELGPGRGTLMADLLRVARLRPGFYAAAEIHLVETSPMLRARQKETLREQGSQHAWADRLEDVPGGAPLYLIANEFFDALPIRQFVRQDGQWLERAIGLNAEGQFAFTLLPPATAMVKGPAPQDAVAEINEPALQIAQLIGERLNADGGLALVMDYGSDHAGFGDTLQAVKRHRFARPLDSVGEADLTAHVRFPALARASGATVHGPVTQGRFLRSLGIEARAAALGHARAGQAEQIAAAIARLTGSNQMGTLFKAMALTGRNGPVPAGFAP